MRKLFLILINLYLSCKINDKIDGRCVNKENVIDKITFCKNYIPDNICVPFESVLIN